MSKKLTQGEGWKVTFANEEEKPKEIVSKSPDKQKIKLSIDKRKKGKVVTLLKGLVLNENDLKDLTKTLKNACGTGGTIESGVIELQGDCQDKVRLWLKDNGWGVN